ncbi:MAG TPA: hypothetical protein PLK76_03410 [bacterium]|nr:hypothetical protein [bacterium]
MTNLNEQKMGQEQASLVEKLKKDIRELENKQLVDRGDQGMHFLNCQCADGVTGENFCSCGHGPEEILEELSKKRTELARLTGNTEE